ncbi:MAG: hypothetical protein AAGP08_01545 [Pseudomonadota bacterium]
MRAVLILCTFLIAACEIIPRYNSEADTLITGAYQDISTILAKADLGAFTSKSSFAGEIDTYASIIGKLETAKISVGNKTPTNSRQPAAKTGATLDSIIGDCITQVKAFSDDHRDRGIIPGIGATQPVRVACDAAARAIGVNRPLVGGN